MLLYILFKIIINLSQLLKIPSQPCLSTQLDMFHLIYVWQQVSIRWLRLSCWNIACKTQIFLLIGWAGHR